MKTLPQSLRAWIAATILVSGAAIHGFLCLPAIRARSHVGFDPAWLAVVHLWIVPVIVWK